MIKQFFSFEGRIRRTKYGISVVTYAIGFVSINIMTLKGMVHYKHTEYIMLAHLPLLWFLLAQGAKRCHDLDQPGWWQLAPFYMLWLLFKDGQPHQNRYGNEHKKLN